MKKLFFSLVLFFLFTSPVEAHILKTDSSIGAVIHIDPEDDPIAGKQSTFYFDFKDTKGTFTPTGCDCVFSVLQNGKEIFSQAFFEGESTNNNAHILYTFPERGIYQVKVTGKPITSGAFEPFVLLYDIRVERVADSQKTSAPDWVSWITSHIIQLIGGAALIGIGLLLFLRKKIK